MSLGVCCQWLEPYTKRDGSVVYENSINERSLQLGRFQKDLYSKSYIREVYINNINELLRVVPKLTANNLKLFRVTTHPDQFVVLSSDNPVTVNNAIKELSHHAWVFDKMHLPASPYAAINIHGGKSDRLGQLIQVVRNLPDNVRSRLTFENDESAYNLVDLLKVNSVTGVPVVWDSHHHTFNDGDLSLDDAYSLSVYTWKASGCKPLQHLSNTTPGLENGNFTDRRKHSDFIHYIPDCQREGLLVDVIDVDVEAKMKNLALMKLRAVI
jgi:UV DNA damage endonuclease